MTYREEKTTFVKIIDWIFTFAVLGIITFLGTKWIVQVEQQADVIKGRVFIEGSAYYCQMGTISKKKLALIKEAESLKE